MLVVHVSGQTVTLTYTDMLGRREAVQYLRFVIKACSERLREARAEPLIRDEVRVELLNYFRSAQQSLSALLVQGAQEFVKALETTRYLHRGGAREDVQDFLEAVHRIIGVEQQTDEAQRNAKRALVRGDFSEKELYVYTGPVKSLEESADALMHAALMLRDYVLGEVMLISAPEALARLHDIKLDRIMEARVAPGKDNPVLCHATAASAGVAIGARQFDKVCLVGCEDLRIDLASRGCTIGEHKFFEGDMLCLDANTGRVLAGRPRIVVEKPLAYLSEVERWRVEAAEAVS